LSQTEGGEEFGQECVVPSRSFEFPFHAAKVRTTDADALDLWLIGTLKSELRLFAQSLNQDEAVIRAAPTLFRDSGAVEGDVIRFKLIKRQGYGRQA